MNKGLILVFLTLISYSLALNDLKGLWNKKTQEELEEILRIVYNNPPYLI